MQDNLGFIVVGVSIIVILAVSVRHNLFQDASDMMKALKIGKHNVEYQLSPDRRKPLVIIDKEFSLRQFYPDFFNKFTREDWQEFWDIIYGTHSLIDFQDEKLPPAQRNYYISEIQKVLAERYPDFFALFGQEHWKMFWKEIFGIANYNLMFGSDAAKDKSDSKLQQKMMIDDRRISSTVGRVRKEIGK